MIKFRNKTLEEYSIDPETAVITNSKGEIQEITINDGRPYFKGYRVHQLQMHTHIGYKRGYVIHHLDKNTMNNALENLVYITQSEHSKLHNHDKKGFKHSSETRKKISDANKGENHPLYGKHHSSETKKKIGESIKGKRVGENHPLYGKHHSSETREKISKANKGKHHSSETRKKMSKANKGQKNPMYGKHYKWINNGIEQRRIPFDEEIPEGFKRGMLKNAKISNKTNH